MSTSMYAGDALRDFPAAVQRLKAAGLKKRDAITTAVLDDPARHEAYVRAINEERDRRRAAARAPRQRRP